MKGKWHDCTGYAVCYHSECMIGEETWFGKTKAKMHEEYLEFKKIHPKDSRHLWYMLTGEREP